MCTMYRFSEAPQLVAADGRRSMTISTTVGSGAETVTWGMHVVPYTSAYNSPDTT